MATPAWIQNAKPYFIYLLLVSTLGPFLFGFHLAELNTPADVITCKREAVTAAGTGLPQCILMSPTEWGLVGSMYTLGGLLGALSAGPLAERYGRLRVMQAMTAFFVLGPVFEAAAPHLGVLTVGRLVSGVGAGAAVVVVPIYISEISPSAERGFFGAFTQIMTNVGILVTQLLGYFLSRGQLWRWILAAGGVFGAAQGAGLLLAVESPKYLAEQGDVAQARRTLRQIRGTTDVDHEVQAWRSGDSDETNDEEETLLQEESYEPIAANGQAKEDSLSILQVLRHPDYRKAALSVIVVMTGQQFSGINSIIMYGVPLLASLLQSNSALLNLVVSAINIVVTASAAPLADKLGRKACLLNSLAGMGVSSLLLAVGIMRAIKALSAVAVLLFVGSFGLGLGPVPFILASELVGPEAVGATQSIALGANWIATFVVAQFFPLAMEVLHGRVFFIFAALSACFFLFISWFVPETKGKRSVDEVWGRERRVD